jgi:hypothetical protein
VEHPVSGAETGFIHPREISLDAETQTKKKGL